MESEGPAVTKPGPEDTSHQKELYIQAKVYFFRNPAYVIFYSTLTIRNIPSILMETNYMCLPNFDMVIEVGIVFSFVHALRKGMHIRKIQ